MSFTITWNKSDKPYIADTVCVRTIVHPHGVTCVQIDYRTGTSDRKCLAVTPASGSVVRITDDDKKTLFDSTTDRELELTVTHKPKKRTA